jgi:cytochrome c biogenesis protein CcdA
MRGSFKATPGGLIRAHRKTYVDARTGKRRWRDTAAFEIFPLIALAVFLVSEVTLRPNTAIGLLTVSGLLSAFLFGVMLQVSQRAVAWADAGPDRGRETSEHAIYLEELSANAGYASMVAIAAAIAFTFASTHFDNEWIPRVASAIGVALGLHLVLTLLMVMKRVFALTQQRLNRARTDVTRASRSRRNAA